MTNSEREHLARVAEMGCIICGSPAEIHHVRAGMGMGQRNDHFNVIPLCPNHHRNGGYGVAFHAGKKGFEAKYGTEAELLETVRLILG